MPPVIYTGIRGRDGSTTAAIEIPPHKAKECLNVDFYRAALGRKRGGATNLFSVTTGEDTASVVSALARHVPGSDETLAELWQVTGAATPLLQRLAGGTVWATITPKTAILTRPQDAWPITFNGKLFWLADTAVDRMQVFDPAQSTTALRYVGLGTPSAPTVADTGAGTYAATARVYRVRFTIQVSGTTVLRGEPSSPTSFTPSGAGTAARVTKPATISESETHWELEAAAATTGPWYVLATSAVGTTTYDDAAAVSVLSLNALAPESGEYVAPGSFKYGIADGARILLAGTWESSLDPSSVYFTPVLGTTSAGYYDDERVPANNRIPLDPKDGGVITGLGALDIQVLAFKYRQVWRLTPTGIEADPYRRKNISKVIGAIRQHAVVLAEDASGNPTVYWLSHLGPYRYNLQGGLAKLVWDITDIWDTVNLDATTVTCHGVYHADRHQIWWWVATGSANDPDTKIVYDTRLGRVVEAGDVRDGWAVHTGASARARCSVMFSHTVGASMSRDLKPYIGQHGGAGRLWKCDTADLDDAGTTFQGLITFPDRHFGGLDRACALRTPLVLGDAGTHEISVTMTPDYDASRARTGTVSMEASGEATRVLRVVEGVEMGEDVSAVAVAIGDAAAVASRQWTVDAVVVPVEARQTRVVG